MYLPHFFISLLINLLNLINWFSEFLLPKCKVVSPYILLTKNKSTLKNYMSCLWNKNQDVLFLCVLLQYLNYRGTSWILQINYRRPFFSSPLFISMNYESNQIRQNAYSMNCLLRKLSYFASLFVQCISIFDHGALSTTCTRQRNQCIAIWQSFSSNNTRIW